jgi:hypothetical protein
MSMPSTNIEFQGHGALGAPSELKRFTAVRSAAHVPFT